MQCSFPRWIINISITAFLKSGMWNHEFTTNKTGMLHTFARNSLKMVAKNPNSISCLLLWRVMPHPIKEEQHMILFISNSGSSNSQWEMLSRVIYKWVVQNFPCQNSSADMWIILKGIWLRVTRFCTRMSLFANYAVNTSARFKIRQSNGQTVLTQPAVADGRIQDVWSLPDPWLHLQRTALGGVAHDHYFLLPTIFFSLYLLHPSPVSAKKIKVWKSNI